MDKIRLFAVASVSKPPVKLSRKGDEHKLMCTLTSPLPPQLLIFNQGEWQTGGDNPVTLHVYLNSEKIGEMEENTKCFTWDTEGHESKVKGHSMTLEVRVMGMMSAKIRKGAVKKTGKQSSSSPQQKKCEEDQKEKESQPTNVAAKTKKLKAPKADVDKATKTTKADVDKATKTPKADVDKATETPKADVDKATETPKADVDKATETAKADDKKPCLPEKAKITKVKKDSVKDSKASDSKADKPVKRKYTRRLIPPTSSLVKKTRQTQLNFCAAKVKVTPPSENEMQKKAAEQDTAKKEGGTAPKVEDKPAGKKVVTVADVHCSEEQTEADTAAAEVDAVEQASTLEAEKSTKTTKKETAVETKSSSIVTKKRGRKTSLDKEPAVETKSSSIVAKKRGRNASTDKEPAMETKKRGRKTSLKRPATKRSLTDILEEASKVSEKNSPAKTEERPAEERSPLKTEQSPSLEASPGKTKLKSPKNTKDKLTEKTEKSPKKMEDQLTEKTEDMSPTKTEDMEVDKDIWCDVQGINENTPQVVTADIHSPLPRKPMKKRQRKNLLENSPEGPTPKKRGTRMRALKIEGTPKSCRGRIVLGDSDLKENAAPDGQDPARFSQGQMTRCVDLAARAPSPSARWGHSLLMSHPGLAVLIGGQGGQGEKLVLSKDSVWTLNTATRRWQSEEVQVEGQKPEYRMGHTATYDPTMRCVYIFGGSKSSRWFHDVHVYDLDEAKWTLAKVEGKAPTRAYHSANLHRHELWVFGGVYPRPDPNPDGCSNDVHIFSPVMKTWYSPLVQGQKPLARSGHSATLIGDQLVMFGGWDAPVCYNDLFILDLTTVDWSRPDVKGTPPKPRSWHASCALSKQRIFIHGGYDGNNALQDSFIFNLGTQTWSELVIPGEPRARAGHSALCMPYTHDSQQEDEVLVFGGGDNDGEFFDDLLAFNISFTPVTLL